MTLPDGLFLLCGDRAWYGLPAAIRGGPCTLGRLTLLQPNISALQILRQPHGKRHSLDTFQKNCNSRVTFWNAEKTIFASFFVPGVAAAQALTSLRKLECWLAKETNATTSAIKELLVDIDSIRHATLQNRAAIDFLLLVHGHGCQEFEGMCCMNLSDHSKSISAHLAELDNLTQQLKVDNSWNFFSNLRWGWPWLQKLLLLGLLLLLIFSCILCCIPVLLPCMRRMISQLMAPFEVRLI